MSPQERAAPACAGRDWGWEQEAPAARLRGKKGDSAAPKAHTKAEGGGPKKGSTPRKAGGS